MQLNVKEHIDKCEVQHKLSKPLITIGRPLDT